MRAIIVKPSQYALKLPATNPERMLSDAPPSAEDFTTSRTCPEFIEVKTFTNSGMIAPASVPHVIMSRWNVDSAETTALMKRFYAELLTGEDVASSLRAAELALASQPLSMHPYYWAAFEVQGVK